VSKLQILNDEHGVNFTHATLATIMKYPWASGDIKCKLNKNKYGYFEAENDLVAKIRQSTQLQAGIRHPATLLLEAADDMAYLNADIEDAVKKEIIPWEQEYKDIKEKLIRIDRDSYGYMFNKLDEIYKENKSKMVPGLELISVQNFKVFSQSLMFKHTVKSFKDNYDDIINGIYNDELLNHNKILPLVKELKRLARDYCFNNPEVITLELLGHDVINGLLDKFVLGLTSLDIDTSTRTYEGKLFSLISENFRFVCCYNKHSNQNKDFKDINLYEKLLLITDFIAGMTDRYAVYLYRTLTGVNLLHR